MRADRPLSLEPVPDAQSLLDLTGDDPWIRWGIALDPFPRCWHAADAGVTAVVRRRRAFGSSLVVLGPAQAVSHAAQTLVPSVDADLITVPRAAAGLIRSEHPDQFPGDGAQWDWMWTTTAPLLDDRADGAALGGITVLDDAEPAVAQQIRDLLERASPRHSVDPGNPRVRRWVGVWDDDERTLLACAAHYEAVDGVPLLASIAVDPVARGRRLGGAVTAWLTSTSLAAGAPAVTVDLYADNDIARRLYGRLGYRLAHEFTSWPLPR